MMKNYFKYLPISDMEKKWGFYITTAGYTHISPEEVYPPVEGHPSSHAFTWDKGRILNGYYLVFISKGQGVFESMEVAPTVLSEGTCFFLFPNVWHRYKPDLSTGWEEYWVGFNGQYPEYLIKSNFCDAANPFVRSGLNESLLLLFKRLLETVQNGVIGYHQTISGITLEILALIHSLSIYKSQDVDPDKQLIHKAIFLLRESLEQPVKMHKLVQELPMGYSKFRKLFKEVTGYSPHQYQLILKIDKAKTLLQTTDLKINEVAYHTGFESEFYLSRLFKKKVGVSPLDYRTAHKATVFAP